MADAPPGIGQASAGDGEATVSWSAPPLKSGSTVYAYVVTPYIGTMAQARRVFFSTATTQVVDGLANGSTYTFQVQALNINGQTASSGMSNPVTPSDAIIAVGGAHTCALPGDGTVRCWGRNDEGQLGNGTTTSSSTPVTVTGITTATQISAGSVHTCARLADGTLRCWGRGVGGELGNGTTSNSSTPVTVTGITTATTIDAFVAHTCARLTDGTLRCWGFNDQGELGDGTTTSSSTPVTVTGITTATSIGAGGAHSCARLADGTLRCWGDNDYGQLGDGTTSNSSAPVTVINL
ncbi:MAG: fibronectin type III domain-containing protein [Microthrixaceae bacterium]